MIVDPLVALALALDFMHNSKIVLACVGENDRRWDGSRPISKAWVPEVACGYPTGTHKKTVGNCMFRDTKPSEEGVYTFRKIVYVPGKKGHTKKTGEVVHYRKVEESDIPAIKKKFKLHVKEPADLIPVERIFASVRYAEKLGAVLNMKDLGLKPEPTLGDVATYLRPGKKMKAGTNIFKGEPKRLEGEDGEWWGWNVENKSAGAENKWVFVAVRKVEE